MEDPRTMSASRYPDMSDGPNFSAEDVRAHRERTGMGVKECEAALTKEWMESALMAVTPEDLRKGIGNERTMLNNLHAIVSKLVEKY